MISTNSSYSELDNVGLKFYNGRPTIKSKVRLASQQVSGIMIWEVGQDCFDGNYSIMKHIDKYLDGKEVTLGVQQLAQSIEVVEEKGIKYLKFPFKAAAVEYTDVNGKKLGSAKKTKKIKLDEIPKGTKQLNLTLEGSKKLTYTL